MEGALPAFSKWGTDDRNPTMFGIFQGNEELPFPISD